MSGLREENDIRVPNVCRFHNMAVPSEPVPGPWLTGPGVLCFACHPSTHLSSPSPDITPPRKLALSLLWLDLLHPHLPQPRSHLLWSCPPGAQGQVVCLCVSTRLGALCGQEPRPVFLASLCPAGILAQMWHHSICWLLTSLTAPITPLPSVETERGSDRTVPATLEMPVLTSPASSESVRSVLVRTGCEEFS